MALLLGFASPAVFSGFLTVILFLSLVEFNRMGLGQNHRLEQWVAAILGASILPVVFCQNAALLLPMLTAAFLIFSLLFLFRLPSIAEVHHRLGWVVLGLVYLPLPLGHLIFLRSLTDGRQWIFMTLMVIMACDSFAYFVGSQIGRRKLYPAVSPNKSVEGALGGLAGAVLAVMLAKYAFLPVIGLVDGVLIGILLGVVGQLGDLFESLLKRACGVKDSGHIIPGHGGILDRLDSLLFAFPVIFYVVKYGYGG